MTRLLLLAAATLLAVTPARANAQHAHHGTMPQHGDTTRHQAHHGMMSSRADTTQQHGMKTPCPLHMTGLNTTPAQDSAIAGVRASHMTEMMQVHAAHGSDSTHARMADPAMREHMKASMGRAMDAMRAVLTDDQRQRLAAAAAAHDAEKAEMAARGTAHDCAACCSSHHAMGDAAAKHEH